MVDLAQVGSLVLQTICLLQKTVQDSKTSILRPNPNRPTQVPQGIDLAQVGILILQTFPAPEDRPRLYSRPLSATPFSSVDSLVPDRELAQVCRLPSKKISLIYLASCSLARLKVSKKSCQKSVEQ